MQTFRDTILRSCPRWLRRHWGSRLLYAIGTHFDALIDLTAAGVRARYPGYSPPDGVAAIGRDRQIRRGFDEPLESYIARLLGWIPARKTRGNPYTLMRQLHGYFTGHSVRIRTVNNAGAWHTIHHDGTLEFHPPNGNWDWDGETDPWSRFWVILYVPTSLWGPDGVWGSPGVWGDGGVWGLSATHEQARTVAAIINEWKPPHSVCAGVIVCWDMFAFDPTDPAMSAGFPTAEWGRAGKDDGFGNYVMARPSWARFTGEL